ncbi:hypothetical protein I3760_07G052400 [Carya illinoinensis]|nr:hypothetical protein I3760_07G052400 [Carya illinoinensis]
MAENTRMKDLQEGLNAQKKTTEQHIKNMDSQFNTICVEMLAMRRQMELMLKQFSGMAADLQSVKTALASAPQPPPQNNQHEQNSEAQMVPHNAELHPRSIRLDFPLFQGDNPHGWLFKVNHFFTYHNIFPQHKLRLVALHMEGKALVWFQDLEESGTLNTWEAFVKALLMRFGPTTYDDPMEQLAKLSQKGTVDDYKTDFEALSNRLHDIRVSVKMFSPTDLLTAYGLAKMQEEKIFLRKKGSYRNFSTHSASQNPQPPYLKHLPHIQPTDNQPNQPKAIVPVHKVSQSEMRERRAKGLCYSCDSKWAPGHKCSSPKLYLIEKIEESYVVVDIDNKKEEMQEANPNTSVSAEPPAITLHAIIGSLNPKTMRVVGKIDPSLLSKLSLPVFTTDKVKVKIANGDQIQSEGSLKHVALVVQNLRFSVDLYLLVLAGCDIVLGVQWLQGLGSILWNFHNLTMQFTYHDSPVILNGLKGNSLMEEGLFNRPTTLEKKGPKPLFIAGSVGKEGRWHMALMCRLPCP